MIPLGGDRARAHYRKDPDAAARVALTLIEAGNSLADFPHRGRPIPGTTRRELIAEFEYIIRHRVLGARPESSAFGTPNDAVPVRSAPRTPSTAAQPK
jgi:hypothetical protein